MVKKSATLVMNELVQRREREGHPVVNLGFGEAGLPALESLEELVRTHASLNAYPAVQGGLTARTAVAGYFTRRGISVSAERCVLAPGSKALLFSTLKALDGDLVLPKASWVSYAAQAHLIGKRIIWVDPPAPAGGVPDPEKLEVALDAARKDGGNPGIMLLTSPDNPSGTVGGINIMKKLAQIAQTQDLAIISDEIYRDLAYDQNGFTSVASFAPERTFVTTGLSKSLALGGWRIGAEIVPDSDLGQRVLTSILGTASEVWSGMPIFLEPVVEYSFSEPDDVRERIERSRHLHEAVSTAIWKIMTTAGAKCRKPEGAFYLYPTFEGSALAHRLGVSTDSQLSDALMQHFDVATLPGTVFGDDATRMGLRVVTSMLYGTSRAQRLETLASANPLEEPSVSAGLERISAAFESGVRSSL